MPHDLPPWAAVYQQMQHWIRAGCFELLVQDVQLLLREFAGRKGQPTAVAFDSRTLQSTPESGARAGYDGAKRRKELQGAHRRRHPGPPGGTPGYPRDAGDRAQGEALAEELRQVTGNSVDLAYGDQGYTGETAAEAARQHGIRLEVVNHPMAKRSFVLLPHRWVAERSFAWAARFRHLGRDYERLDTTLKGLPLPVLRVPHAHTHVPSASLNRL